ncbi:MAG: hypothetical protein LBQ54_07480, partial [Planctomycetaceae bacterium]|nr:hypothetical protein [Planctomycetaceae bacterium]
FAKLTDLESIQLFGPEVNDEGFLKLVPLKNLKTVLIENANLSNVSLEVIRDNMPNLTKLALNRIELNNEGLEIVSQMKNVEHLEIRANNIDVFGLLVLGNMEKLKVLDLRNCTSLTDLKYLRKAKNLQVVKLRNAITDRSISSLAECVHLTSVDLQDMEDVSDDSAEALASIPKLRDLSLFRMKYSDEILLKLEGKPLERLLLRGNPNITDKGIPLLKTMKSLNRLNLSELGSVTDESVKAVLEGNTVINNLVLWSMPGLSDETGVALGTMTNLKTLEIRGNSGMTGKTLEAVAALPKLETLTVGESGYPLEDVEKLTALPSLKSLTIYGDKTQVEALIAKIQPQMPNCKISFKGAGGAGE